jgi:hypothetical protein
MRVIAPVVFGVALAAYAQANLGLPAYAGGPCYNITNATNDTNGYCSSAVGYFVCVQPATGSTPGCVGNYSAGLFTCGNLGRGNTLTQLASNPAYTGLTSCAMYVSVCTSVGFIIGHQQYTGQQYGCL